MSHFDLGIPGAAYAINLTQVLTLIFQIVYVGGFLEQVRDAWFWPTSRTFASLWPYLKLALPGMLMLFLEEVATEVLVIFAGALFDDVKVLAAQIILVAVTQFMIMVPYGLSLAAVQMVGHALGANKPNLAVANCKLFFQFTTIFNMIVALALILSKSAIINLFTDDSEVI